MKLLKADIPSPVEPDSRFNISLLIEYPVLNARQIAGISLKINGEQIGYQMTTSIGGMTTLIVPCRASHYVETGRFPWRGARKSGEMLPLPEGDYSIEATGSIWAGYATLTGYRYYGTEPLQEFNIGTIGILSVKKSYDEWDFRNLPWIRNR